MIRIRTGYDQSGVQVKMKKTVKHIDQSKRFTILRIAAWVVVSLQAALLPVSAQQEIPYTEEITVISPYKPTITESFKISQNPRIETQNLQKPELSYSIQEHLIQTTFDPQPIKPVAIVGEPIDKLYRNFIRGGFGNYRTPYLEFFAGSLRSKEFAFGVHLRHLSSGEMKDHPSSSQSDNTMDVWGKKFLKKHTLSGNLLYDRTMVHYYGYDDSLAEAYDVSKEKLRQTYNLIGMQATLESSHRGDKINTGAGFGYAYLFNRDQTKEHHGNLQLNLDKNLSLMKFTSEEKLTVKVRADVFGNADSLVQSTSALIGLEPVLDVFMDEYSFRIGFNASVGIDSLSKIHFYPLVEVAVAILPGSLKAYLGLKGGIERMNFRKLSDANPFLNATPQMRFTSERYHLYGGINSRIGKFVDWMVQVSGSGCRNLAFFVNDTSTQRNKDLENQFAVIYDDGSVIHGKTEITFRKTERLGFSLMANYYKYSLDHEAEAWHKPAYDLLLSGKYNLQDKFLLTASFIYNGKTFAKTWQDGLPAPKELKGYLDVNLGLEYRYNKNLSGFIQLNNLTNQTYYRWNNYASQKLNGLIGVTYAF
ncbi:MAG TPA: hypothetical protein PKI34_08945 [Bacteroidales bacterium]|nr:hypothetical protein [Bacteroidales bacterium]